jgi:hypothetical protein
MTKLKKQLKKLFLIKQGWAGWILANIITSMHWATPALLGVVFYDPKLISVFIKNFLYKKERSIPEQRTDQKGRTNQ